MRVRQKDIADQLGLSTSLVSRALAGKAASIGVRPETVHQIERTAQRMGYIPSAAARQLRGASTGVLGAVASDLEDPFFGPLVAEIIRQIHQAGYALSMAGADPRGGAMPELNLLLEQQLSGLIVVGSGEIPWIGPFVRRGIRISRIGTGPTPRGVCSIGIDESRAADQLADHLAALGHRSAAIAGADIPVHRTRGALLARSLRRHGIRVAPPDAITGSGSVLDAGLWAAQALLKNAAPGLPTAVVCSSDAVALGMIRELTDAGLRVPADISVTGFDDLSLARLMTPTLTTVRQPLPELVRRALAPLFDPSTPLASEVVAGQLIPRASTAMPRSARHLSINKRQKGVAA